MTGLPTTDCNGRSVSVIQRAELLAVKNGVLNMTTGEFRTATAGDWLRRQANVAYDPNALSKTWRRFMRSVTCNDLELANFIRRAFGYTAIGHANFCCDAEVGTAAAPLYRAEPSNRLDARAEYDRGDR